MMGKNPRDLYNGAEKDYFKTTIRNLAFEQTDGRFISTFMPLNASGNDWEKDDNNEIKEINWALYSIPTSKEITAKRSDQFAKKHYIPVTVDDGEVQIDISDDTDPKKNKITIQQENDGKMKFIVRENKEFTLHEGESKLVLEEGVALKLTAGSVELEYVDPYVLSVSDLTMKTIVGNVATISATVTITSPSDSAIDDVEGTPSRIAVRMSTANNNQLFGDSAPESSDQLVTINNSEIEFTTTHFGEMIYINFAVYDETSDSQMSETFTGTSFLTGCPLGQGYILNCINCSIGKFSNVFEPIECQDVEAGHKVVIDENTKRVDQELCSNGFYSGTNTDDCIECGPGLIIDDSTQATEANACENHADCVAGKYTSAVGSSSADPTCLDCDPGKFQSSPSESTEEMSECSSTVQAGHQVVFSGDGNNLRINEEACAAGHYSGAQSDGCTECGSGKILDDSTQSSEEDACTDHADCVAGKYNATVGTSSTQPVCDECGEGKFQSSLPESTVVMTDGCSSLVQAGYQVVMDVNGLHIDEEVCAAGHYSGGGVDYCSICTAGNYTANENNEFTDTGAKKCEPCSGSQYDHDDKSSTICVECSVGYYRNPNNNTKTSCIPCPVGHYDDDQSYSTVCIPCPAGKFVNTEGQDECDTCSVGTYQSIVGQTNCESLSAGHEITMTDNLRTGFKLCEPGHFSDGTQDNCTKCENGSYLKDTGSIQGTQTTACESCEEYFFSNNGISCTECSIGYEIINNASCDECNLGYFTNSVRQCIPWNNCEEGTEVTNDPNTIYDRSCSVCQESYTDTIDNKCTDWDNCGPGTKTNVEGTTTTNRSCTSCAEGSFSENIEHNDKCYVWTECQEGEKIASNGSATQNRICTTCVAGEYSILQNATTCEKCPSGTYSEVIGLSTSNGCIPCGENYYQDNPGQTSCIPCADNYKSIIIDNSNESIVVFSGGTDCISVSDIDADNCQQGSYLETNPISCIVWDNCGPGTETFIEGSSTVNRTCIPCENEHFSQNENHNNECQPWITCQQGEMIVVNGTKTQPRTCTQCVAGKYSIEVNETMCEQCLSGTYSTTVGLSDPNGCISCPENYFQERLGQTNCIECTTQGYISADMYGTPVTEGGQRCISSFPAYMNTYANSYPISIIDNIEELTDYEFKFITKDENIQLFNTTDTSEYMSITHEPTKIICSFIAKTPYIFIKTTYNTNSENDSEIEYFKNVFTTTLIPYNSSETYETQVQQINHIDEDLMLNSLLHLLPTISQTYSSIVFCDPLRIKKIDTHGNSIDVIGINTSIICAYKCTHSHLSSSHIMNSIF